MSNRKQSLGQWGEETAVQYLRQNGFTILARNVRTRGGEVDIVALKEGGLVFVEVKARSSVSYLHPEEAVTRRKQARMLAVAEQYIQDHPDSGEAWQFDIIAITCQPGQIPLIEHFENVIE